MHLFMLTGRVVKQAEVRPTTNGNGTQAISFRVAVNTSYLDKETGERKEVTTYYNAVIWKRAGKSTKIAESLVPGKVVEIHGLPKATTYTDKDNNTKAEIEVRVDRIELFGGGNKDAASTAVAQNDTNSVHDDDNDLPF